MLATPRLKAAASGVAARQAISSSAGSGSQSAARSRSLTDSGASTGRLNALPVHLQRSYRARYRDPETHEAPVQSTSTSYNYIYPRQASSQPPSRQHHAPQPTSSTRSNVVPSKNREEMENRWVPADPAIDTHRPLSNVAHPSSSSGPAKTALLTPGSGSQYVGMGQFLLQNYKSARDVWEEAEESLSSFEGWRKDLGLDQMEELKGLDLSNWSVWQKERSAKELRHIVMNGPQDELTRSSNMQPAIHITTQMFLRALEQDFSTPISRSASFFAGHSSGEYSACVASGMVSFAEGVKLTRLHGLLTSRTLQLSSLKSYSEYSANDEERAQMSALLLHPGATVEDVEAVIKQTRNTFKANSGMVEIASYNSSHQLVLSGSRAGVLNACDILMDKNIASRAADLPVFAPFHCSFMALAAIGMTHAWNATETIAPRAPLVSNLDASLVTTPEKLKSDIVASIHKPVLWSPALDVMRQHGTTRFIFLGPGKALANLAKKECKSGGKWEDWKEVQIASVATQQDLEDVARLCSDLSMAQPVASS